ncbi:MAG: hypothetical protein V1854_04915 [Methanobacteriota archaeon]
MTICEDCGEEGAHYLSRYDGKMRCWRCQGKELVKPGHLLSSQKSIAKHRRLS